MSKKIIFIDMDGVIADFKKDAERFGNPHRPDKYVDYCNLDNLQAFYDFFNEDIDIVLPTPPPELKRLYDLFSIKITKLLGDYERDNLRLNSNYYTNSADGRNVDFDNKISTSTYTVTAYTLTFQLLKD